MQSRKNQETNLQTCSICSHRSCNVFIAYPGDPQQLSAPILPQMHSQVVQGFSRFNLEQRHLPTLPIKVCPHSGKQSHLQGLSQADPLEKRNRTKINYVKCHRNICNQGINLARRDSCQWRRSAACAEHKNRAQRWPILHNQPNANNSFNNRVIVRTRMVKQCYIKNKNKKAK